jgi:hypothetical protein
VHIVGFYYKNSPKLRVLSGFFLKNLNGSSASSLENATGPYDNLNLCSQYTHSLLSYFPSKYYSPT